MPWEVIAVGAVIIVGGAVVEFSDTPRWVMAVGAVWLVGDLVWRRRKR